MVVVVRIEVDDTYRRALRSHYGQPGLATRADVRDHVVSLIDADSDDLTYDLERAEERGD